MLLQTEHSRRCLLDLVRMASASRSCVALAASEAHGRRVVARTACADSRGGLPQLVDQAGHRLGEASRSRVGEAREVKPAHHALRRSPSLPRPRGVRHSLTAAVIRSWSSSRSLVGGAHCTVGSMVSRRSSLLAVHPHGHHAAAGLEASTTVAASLLFHLRLHLSWPGAIISRIFAEIGKVHRATPATI